MLKKLGFGFVFNRSTIAVGTPLLTVVYCRYSSQRVANSIFVATRNNTWEIRNKTLRKLGS